MSWEIDTRDPGSFNTLSVFNNLGICTSFTAPYDGIISSFIWQIWRDSSNPYNGNLAVSLRNSIGTPQLPGSTILASTTVAASVLSTTSESQHTFTFASSATVLQGVRYWFVCILSGGSAAPAQIVTTLAGAGYALAGEHFDDYDAQSGTWDTHSPAPFSGSFCFYVQAAGTAQNVSLIATSETDAAQAFTAKKKADLALAEEIETAYTLKATYHKPLVIASEADVAQVVKATRNISLAHPPGVSSNRLRWRKFN